MKTNTTKKKQYRMVDSDRQQELHRSSNKCIKTTNLKFNIL